MTRQTMRKTPLDGDHNDDQNSDYVLLGISQNYT